MTVGDMEYKGPMSFYREDSKIVKRQRALHKNALFEKENYYD